ncbi:hypothetical protein [Paraburkholderia sacchari]|uniref:Uncharacterized protein n=1 Tax=Paraburkholderia sacchari TaxID=159450 RepID=A0A8T6ZGW9_9BURK|nr:hypothetical protein [Paraburkholderia sacchari]NLP63998.1 hypothetical protein [Paraburkholderia sacchari]
MGTKIQKSRLYAGFFRFRVVVSRCAPGGAGPQNSSIGTLRRMFRGFPRADADLSRCEDFLKRLIDRVREHAIIAV